MAVIRTNVDDRLGLSRCGDDVVQLVNAVFIMAMMGRRKGDKIGVSVMSRMRVTEDRPTGDGNSRPSGPKPFSGDLRSRLTFFSSSADLPQSWSTEDEKAMCFFLVESTFFNFSLSQ
jgi:hypothetical protein